jgi:MOSC domain-containing protein
MAMTDAQSLLQGSFLSCLHYVLEIKPTELPSLAPEEDPAGGWTVSRWLGGLGMGIARVADPATFSWAGNWIARVQTIDSDARFAVMFGVPSGVVWDPGGDGVIRPEWITEGFLVAATDITQARPPLPAVPTQHGAVEAIWVAPSAGVPARSVTSVRALPGRGLEGDRHVAGTGTFPSGRPGSALTLVAAEVVESFDPPLSPDEHRRNVLVRGLDVARLVGHEFTVGAVRCRGMRLCEPCRVMERYAGRPVLRALVHRGGLRADILSEGDIHVGDTVRARDAGGLC